MKSYTRRWVCLLCVTVCSVLLPLSAGMHAEEPNHPDTAPAIDIANIRANLDRMTEWLRRKTLTAEGHISEQRLRTVLDDPAIAGVLYQRTFLIKCGADQLEAFAAADPGNKAFLLWIMENREALDMFLLGATPIGFRQREENSFGIPAEALTIWKTIADADPESRQGLYLRLAMATALNPPGTGCRGAGQPEAPETPLSRYRHFKMAHQNGLLFPSFDQLSVWELRHVTCSMASNDDLAWGREMVNTWNPDFRKHEAVVDTTSQVWRRNSPISYGTSYKNVMAGGGKCGPRSSWAVFICQAFGIPATGVGQPGHACVAYRKPDGAWATAYGRGWAASKLLGISGDEFVAGVEARAQTNQFALAEHMRWLALALPEECRPPILEWIRGITQTPALEVARGETAPDTSTPGVPDAVREAPVFTSVDGVIHVEAGSFCDNGGIAVYGGHPGVGLMDSYPAGTGRQIHFAANMGTVWAGYRINVPETGIYTLTAKVATVNSDQSLLVRSYGAMHPVVNTTASTVYKNWVRELGPQQAVDHNPGTRWAVIEGVEDAWLELDLGEPKPISACMIDERFFNRVSRFTVEYKVGDEWQTLFEGTNIGMGYEREFPVVTARNVRLHTLDSHEIGGPTIWEFSVGTVKDGSAWLHLPCTHGLWETTEPVDLRLVNGVQTIWFFAPFQRGVTLKSFELRLTPDRRAAVPAPLESGAAAAQ